MKIFIGTYTPVAEEIAMGLIYSIENKSYGTPPKLSGASTP